MGLEAPGNSMNIMLDLETAGTGPDAAIMAIGAVAFTSTNVISQHYVVVDLEDSVRAGGVIDASTFKWWMKQSQEARSELAKNPQPLKWAIGWFDDFVIKASHYGIDKLNDHSLCLWGNGSDFDNVILSGAYRRLGLATPWPYYGNRCYRTVAALHQDIKFIRSGIHHRALDDALSQANHLINIFKKLGITNEQRNT